VGSISTKKSGHIIQTPLHSQKGQPRYKKNRRPKRKKKRTPNPSVIHGIRVSAQVLYKKTLRLYKYPQKNNTKEKEEKNVNDTKWKY